MNTLTSPTDTPLADVLTRAADILRVHGMYAGGEDGTPDYWDGASDQQIWQPGMAPDPTGAIAVALEVTTVRGLVRLLGHIDYLDPEVQLMRAVGDRWPQPELHPVFQALFAHVGIDPDADEAVSRWFAWCDRQLCHQVIATYRACAEQLTSRGVPA